MVRKPKFLHLKNHFFTPKASQFNISRSWSVICRSEDQYRDDQCREDQYKGATLKDWIQ